MNAFLSTLHDKRQSNRMTGDPVTHWDAGDDDEDATPELTDEQRFNADVEDWLGKVTVEDVRDQLSECDSQLQAALTLPNAAQAVGAIFMAVRRNYAEHLAIHTEGWDIERVEHPVVAAKVLAEQAIKTGPMVDALLACMDKLDVRDDQVMAAYRVGAKALCDAGVPLALMPGVRRAAA